MNEDLRLFNECLWIDSGAIGHTQQYPVTWKDFDPEDGRLTVIPNPENRDNPCRKLGYPLVGQ